MGRTPLAAGSRVPAWPTRFCLRTFRILATTSCEVMPVALLMLRIPSISAQPQFLFQFGEDKRDGFFHGQRNGGSSSAGVAPSPRTHTDSRCIVRFATAQ